MAKDEIRIEILVASPPTSKCKELIDLIEGFVERYPDQLRLDIYYAGSKMSVEPTEGYQNDPDGKRRKVPSAYVDGGKVASDEIPSEKEISDIIESLV